MDCAVVIPVYQNRLSIDEESCVRQYQKVLQGEKLFFVCPKGLDTTYYEENFPEIGFQRFADKYFQGIKGYNHLMLADEFYAAFSAYEYMLIAQTDATIWSEENRLQEFMAMGFDYIGAPWIPERTIWEWRRTAGNESGRSRIRCCKKKGQGITMGNGGFSLRRIKACRKLIKECAWRKCYWFWKRNEDIFFGVCGEYSRCGFRLADVESGLKFSREYGLRESAERGELPYGVHGWQKEFSSYEEMKEFLARCGVSLA